MSGQSADGSSFRACAPCRDASEPIALEQRRAERYGSLDSGAGAAFADGTITLGCGQICREQR
ncbi:hypothetical protein BER93_19045 [Xanthomonas fragariae]|nr:hypothetical protein BER93_19045 [Xanthomonas fragariae]ENZ96597.1 hypothetical protein O1K_03501 [Xanthomonas fragariae LMG 25863]